MSFKQEFIRGQEGLNLGYDLHEGLEAVDGLINGLQRGRILSLGALPKVGKTTVVDVGIILFIANTALEQGLNLCIVYNILETSVVSKQFDFVVYFLARDHGITELTLEDGITKSGKDTIPISKDLLRGAVKDDNKNLIPLPDNIFELVKEIFKTKVQPLCGVYDKNGVKTKDTYIKKGVDGKRGKTYKCPIILKDRPKTPDEFRDEWLDFAGSRGDLQMTQNEEVVSYVPSDPTEFVLIVTDHIRRIKNTPKGRKDSVDTFSGYCVELRDKLNYSFINIIHLNRGMDKVTEMSYPTDDHFKDTGNISEDSDYIFTMMNPGDDKYGLAKHLGLRIRNPQGLLYEGLRTLHLVQNRHGPSKHFRIIMNGANKTIKKFNIEDYG